MDARTTGRQIFAFALAMIAVLGFFVWLLGPWGPKTAEPYSPPAPAPTVAAPVKIEVHANEKYECLRVYRGERELHWQCFELSNAEKGQIEMDKVDQWLSEWDIESYLEEEYGVSAP